MTTMPSFRVTCEYFNNSMYEGMTENVLVRVYLCGLGKYYCQMFAINGCENPATLVKVEFALGNSYFHIEDGKLNMFPKFDGIGQVHLTLAECERFPSCRLLTREYDRETVAKFFLPEYSNVDQLRESVYWRYIMLGLDVARGQNMDTLLENTPEGLLLFDKISRCDSVYEMTMDKNKMPLLFPRKIGAKQERFLSAFENYDSDSVDVEESNYARLSELDEKTFFNEHPNNLFRVKFLRNFDGIIMTQKLNPRIKALFHALAIGYICSNADQFKTSVDRNVILDISTYGDVLSAELQRGSKKLPTVCQVRNERVYQTATCGFTLAVPINFYITLNGDII